MKTQLIGKTSLSASRISLGCMGFGGDWSSAELTEDAKEAAFATIDVALGLGINFFDHADIYHVGKGERIFGEMWARGLPRENVILQTKCGIRFANQPQPGDPTRYDFSYEHITQSVERSLQRLQTDYLDILLLHRPDSLVEPEEVAHAFDDLHRTGKVRYFGVSNHTPLQMELLRKYLNQSIVVNQVRMSLLFHHHFDAGIVAGNKENGVAHVGDGTIEYCRLHDITLQAYGPLHQGRMIGEPTEELPENIRRLRTLLRELSEKYSVPAEAVAIAWLLRHPARIQPVLGTTRIDRLRSCVQSLEVSLSREEWYKLFETARGQSLP